jgi:hypothetical protein
MAWLDFMSRFTQGDLRRNAAGILDVLIEMDIEMDVLRDRCSSLAQKLELLEAQQQKGEGL